MQVSSTSNVEDGRVADLLLTVREVVRRRWLTLSTVFILVGAIGVGVVSLMTPQFVGTARIQIDPSQNPLAATDQAARQALNPEAIETEVSVMRSPEQARRVVDALNLLENPDFAAPFQRQPEGTQMSADDRKNVIAQALLANLSVSREGLTYVIRVAYQSPDPAMAARIANAFSDAYIASRSGQSTGTAARQAQWFEERLRQLGEEVRAADARVANYRAEHGISLGGQQQYGTVVDQQIAPLSGALANAESEAAAARAGLQAARSQIAAGGLDAVAEVRLSPVIGDLRRQRAEVLRAAGEIQNRYGDRHPEALRIREQLRAVDAQIGDEAQRVVSSLQAQAQAADARVSSLRGSVSALQGQRAVNDRAAVIADSMAREAQAQREAYQRMSQMASSSSQNAQNPVTAAVIVDRAQPPVAPSSPNKPLLFALAAVGGLICAGGTVAIQEMLVMGMRTISDLEDALGVPMLAAIPVVPKLDNPADLLLERPTSLFAETLRIARASILGVRSSRSTQVIAFTSALPSEGKTVTSLSFARALAMNGAKTLLLECDVRRAAMRELMTDAAPGPGIVEVLHGEATVEQSVRPFEQIEGLDQMLVKEPYFSSEDLFGDGQMEELLTQLRARYEHIVLDLPPLVGLADARFIAVLADVVTLLVRWDSTPASAAQAALSTLKSDGANPIGSIYTLVDAHAEAIGGLYYTRKYGTYYQAA